MITILRKHKDIISGVFLNGKPLVVENDFKRSEIIVEVTRAERIALYRGAKHCWPKEKKNSFNPVKTFTKKEIKMLELKEKFAGRSTLRKDDVIELYKEIGALYNTLQRIPKKEVVSHVAKTLGRTMHPTTIVRQLKTCEEAKILQVIDKKFITFLELPKTEVPQDKQSETIDDNEHKIYSHTLYIMSLQDRKFTLNTKKAKISVEYENLKDLHEILSLGTDIIEPLSDHAEYFDHERE